MAKAKNDGGGASDSLPRQTRKEKMLHARIPEDLDREIKRRAGNLGMSVSTVVRHVLLNTFNLVEDIVADSTNLALSIGGEKTNATGSAKSPSTTAQPVPNPILGWQEAILNRNAVCDHCNAILRTGSSAAIGINEKVGPPSIVCKPCLTKQLKAAAATDTPAA